MRKLIVAATIFMLLTGCATNLQAGKEDTTVSNQQNANNEGQKPQVTIEMEDGGIIVLELDPSKAPNTVNNFLSLAGSGFYDGVIFHRVISNFMIQGGDPEGTGSGGPGYTIKGEMANNGNSANDMSHVRGVLSMARTSVSYDTAGSQFFIVVEDSLFLDDEYTAFGKVIDGMDVVDKIKDTRVSSDDRPRVAQRIKTMTVETFGVEYSEPEIIK